MNKVITLLVACFVSTAPTLMAQSTAFTYQGRLNTSGSPANNQYEMQFTLFDAVTNGNQVGLPVSLAPVPVTNGLFIVTLDFGAAAFTGANRWLEITLNIFGSDMVPTTLHPRQPITPTPFALHAASFSGAVADNQLSGNVARLNTGSLSYTGRMRFSPPFGSPFLVDSAVRVPNLNADLLDGLDSTVLWKVGGNSITNSSTGFIGTTNDYPFELKAGGWRALRMEARNDLINITAGNAGNYIGGASYGCTISGGGSGIATNTIVDSSFATIGGGVMNTIQSGQWSWIGGGYQNTIQAGAERGVICGGNGNTIGQNTWWGTIGGGAANALQASAHSSTLGGGSGNRIGAQWATISGGQGNVIDLPADFATIGGGWGNRVMDENSTVSGGLGNVAIGECATIAGGEDNLSSNYCATIAGGSRNIASGAYSFAAGLKAHALHPGTFVWADSSFGPFPSTTTNEFSVRATGGVRFVTAIDTNGSNIAGITLAPGSGTWSSLSDRNAKENFSAMNGREILEKVAALPLASWNYKSQDKSIRHLGPTAQDFHAAFGLGENARTITTVDADGVALAAIQGLNAKLEEQLRAKDAELRSLKRQVDDLRELVQSLAKHQGR